MRLAALAALLLMLTAAASAAASQAPRVSIIIDDLGYRLDAGRRAIALPGPVACAILPGAPRSRHLARYAHERGKEVLLHLPMQAMDDMDKPNDPLAASPRGLSIDMNRQALTRALAEAMQSVPYAVGVNNHRGSLVTRHPGHMHWLMQAIREQELEFFVDSYTTHKSVALKLAAENGVAALKRDVFLDADPDPAEIRRQFERLKTLARRNGAALAIGHPYPATLDVLEQLLPSLGDDGIRLVPIRELLSLPRTGAGADTLTTVME